jgi:hypothetical protein
MPKKPPAYRSQDICIHRLFVIQVLDAMSYTESIKTINLSRAALRLLSRGP